jgi:tetratricopeptide (TPR) repeat protein
MKKIVFCFILFLLVSVQPGFAQNKKERALTGAKQAQKLMDEGNTIDAIKLLEESVHLDPGNIDYPFELAYAYVARKEYTLALSYLQPLLEQKEVSDLIYELTGTCYEDLQQTDKAMDTYQAGLKKFPTSGRLYNECGLIEVGKKEYNLALVYFEKGIETDPVCSSNYYWASKLFCHSSESIWGMLYGEIFVNMEPGSKHSDEISKLLYDTYKSQIKFRPDTTFTISFSKQSSADQRDSLKQNKTKLPFGVGMYEPTLALSTLTETSIDLNSLDRIRTRFIQLYFKNEQDKTYPNVLFDFQNEVLQAGHMEAYNHWLLMEGDLVTFTAWHNLNSGKWLSFGTWFKDHRLKMDKDHRFYRGEY